MGRREYHGIPSSLSFCISGCFSRTRALIRELSPRSFYLILRCARGPSSFLKTPIYAACCCNKQCNGSAAHRRFRSWRSGTKPPYSLESTRAGDNSPRPSYFFFSFVLERSCHS